MILPEVNCMSKSKSAFGKPSGPAGKALTDRTLQVYNWRTGRWDPLPGRKEIALGQPADHLSLDGVLRLRIQADQGPLAVRMPTVEAAGFLPEGGTARLAPGFSFPGGPAGVMGVALP